MSTRNINPDMQRETYQREQNQSNDSSVSLQVQVQNQNFKKLLEYTATQYRQYASQYTYAQIYIVAPVYRTVVLPSLPFFFIRGYLDTIGLRNACSLLCCSASATKQRRIRESRAAFITFIYVLHLCYVEGPAEQRGKKGGGDPGQGSKKRKKMPSR